MPMLKVNCGRFVFQAFALCACMMLPMTAYAQTRGRGGDEVKPGEEILQVVSLKSNLKMITLDSRVLELANRIQMVDGFNERVLSAEALSPYRVRIFAEGAGVTSLKLIDEHEKVHVVEVFVEPDTRELKAYLERLFPGTSIEVVGLRDGVVLRGWVTEPTHIPQIIDVAEQFYPTVQNQLNVGGVSQIQMHVKVMEVQRSKIRELGFNFLSLGQQYALANTIGAVAPLAGFDAPFGGPPAVTTNVGDSEISFAITGNSNLFTGFLKALQQESLAKVLAEPVLVTTSGRPASMLAGGEFPVLVPQGVGATTIQWREFGVRMEAVPIVLGNGRLRLDVAPEVSQRDFTTTAVVDGLVIPGISVRRVNTQVEMRFGETLMIGGLISTQRTGTTQKVPFLGELPWIGAAFSRKIYNDSENELLILLTPYMASAMGPHEVPPGGPGTFTDQPTAKELYIDGLLEVPLYAPECDHGGPCQHGPCQHVPRSAPPLVGPGGFESAQSPARSREVQQVGAEQRVNSAAQPADYKVTTKVERPGRETSASQQGLNPNRESGSTAPASGQRPSGLIEPASSETNRETSDRTTATKRGSWFGR